MTEQAKWIADGFEMVVGVLDGWSRSTQSIEKLEPTNAGFKVGVN